MCDETVEVDRKALCRLYGAARQHVEDDNPVYRADVDAFQEAEQALGRDGPYSSPLASADEEESDDDDGRDRSHELTEENIEEVDQVGELGPRDTSAPDSGDE